MTSHESVWRRVMFTALTGLLVVAAASDAAAQRFGRPGTPSAGACFYRDANFEGDYFCVRAGDAIESLPSGLNDQISSIRTFGRNVEVTVFQNRNFGGRSARFGDVRNLRNDGWNDRLSSLQVDGGGRDFDRRDRDREFGGFGNNPERIVRRAYEDVLGREPDESGMRFYRSKIIDEGWSEQQVRESLRNSRENRERSTMTRERASEIVRRAYLSVLRREPDPAGAEGYIARIMRDRWTEADVERELRQSAEFRQARPR